jgi:hypothetical protein
MSRYFVVSLGSPPWKKQKTVNNSPRKTREKKGLRAMGTSNWLMYEFEKSPPLLSPKIKKLCMDSGHLFRTFIFLKGHSFFFFVRRLFFFFRTRLQLLTQQHGIVRFGWLSLILKHLNPLEHCSWLISTQRFLSVLSLSPLGGSQHTCCCSSF